MNKRLSKEDKQVVQEHMKEKETQTQSTVRYHFITTRVVNTGSAHEGRVKSGPSDMSGAV